VRYQKVACITNENSLEIFKTIEYFTEFSLDFFLYIFPNSEHNCPAVFRHYHQGELVEEKTCFLYKGKSRAIMFLVQFIYYIIFLRELKIKKTYIIVADLHFVFLNSIIRFFSGNRLVFWIGDGFPDRHKSLPIYILDRLINFYINNLKYVFFSCPNLKRLYLKDYQSNSDKKVITLGIRNLPINRRPVPNLFGFIGNLRKEQGLELIIEVLKKNKNYHFEVVGKGGYGETLKKLARENNVDRQVSFLGYLEYQKIIDTSARWEVAFAVYDPSSANYTYYADPGKIKLYIELEVPIIMTDITYLAEEIKNLRSGEIVKYDSDSIISSINKIQRNRSVYVSGIKKIKDRYFYKKIYKEGFSDLEKQL